MADKVDKPKKQKAKPKHDEKGVLAALPSTRPERIGSRRGAATRAPAPKTTSATAASTAAAKSASPAARKTSAPRASAAGKMNATAAAKKPSAPQNATAAAKKPSAPRATATRRKAAAPRTFEPTEAAETAAGAADERAAGAVPRAEPTRPQPVREGAPGIGTTGEREQPSSEHGRPSGVELVTTAVQAAGELAQIGLTIGGQILKRAADRVPKP